MESRETTRRAWINIPALIEVIAQSVKKRCISLSEEGMGKPTGRLVRFIRGLERGADHFGKCEICEKHVSEIFKGQYRKEWVRDTGELYYGHNEPCVYGHESCVKEKLKQEIIFE